MVQHLNFNPMYKPAIMQVFGKTLICRDMDKASHFAKTANLDCITLEGTCAYNIRNNYWSVSTCNPETMQYSTSC